MSSDDVSLPVQLLPHPRQASERRLLGSTYWCRSELQRAVDHDEFSIQYQPLVSLVTGELEGVEALLRWQHPNYGTLAAGTFIEAASRAGILGQLLPRLIDDACHTAVALSGGPGHDPYVALNVDPHQFVVDPLVDLVEAALDTTGASAQSLVVEMTERTDVLSDDATLTAAHELHDLGVQLAIDDFGTGHSSLSRLKALPAAKVKIDRSFVRDVVEHREDQAIVASVVMLAGALGLECVAEGVENTDQAALLAELGCATAQGFLWSDAVAPSEVRASLLHKETLRQQHVLDLGAMAEDAAAG